jgi:hypothetical protein
MVDDAGNQLARDDGFIADKVRKQKLKFFYMLLNSRQNLLELGGLRIAGVTQPELQQSQA